MVLLRKYQLEIVFLFFGLTGILWSVLSLLNLQGLDAHKFEWYVALPALIFYIVMLLKIRKRIKHQEHRALTGRSLAYWLALGVVLFASYDTPLSVLDYWSLEIMFILFTIFLADSYWDFRNLTFRGIFSKKN